MGDAGSEAGDYGTDGKTCVYNDLNQDLVIMDDDDDAYEYQQLEPTDIDTEDMITRGYLTRVEMVRIIGTRAKQLSLGAKPFIKNTESLHPRKVAYLELKYKVIPYIIKRPLPNKKYEYIRIKDCELIHEIDDPHFI